MTINFHNLNKVLSDIENYPAELLIVTKNQSLKDIQSLISKGFKLFGENRVQEAKKKYKELSNLKKINLHLIGPLQTNKVKDALKFLIPFNPLIEKKL